MTATDNRPVVLDAGALIAVERGATHVRAFTDGSRMMSVPLLIPAPALAQVWRDPARQARLSRLVRLAEIVPLDHVAARGVGWLLTRTGTRDVVDAHVALVAGLRNGIVLTSDPEDLKRLCPRQPVIAV
jgi:predicted nucleic acid-binding protein